MKILSGDSLYRVAFLSDETLVREETVRVRIEVAIDVAVSTRAIDRDAELRASDVKMASRWFTKMPASAITIPEDAIGKKLTCPVRPNCELTRNMLKTPVLVKKGRTVRIVLESGPMSVNTMGISEEDGGRDDVIKVRNLSSSKTIYARIIDSSMVKVDF